MTPSLILSSALSAAGWRFATLPQDLKPGAEGPHTGGETAAGGSSEERQDVGDSDSSGQSMGLLLDSDPLSSEERTTATGGEGKVGGKGDSRARTANGGVVDTAGRTANHPINGGAASSAPSSDQGNKCLRNGEIETDPTASTTGAGIRSANSKSSESSNSKGRGSSSSRGAGGETGKKKERGVEVSADNVWEAFLATRPSLSREDRARYDSAYRKFRGGSRPADFNPISSVDDGTLRTALK